MPTRLARWLVTSPNGTWRVRGNTTAWVPYSVPHAREVGAPLTACGRFAVGWVLFWDIPFDAEGSGVCSDCAEILDASPARTSTPRHLG